MMGDGSRGGDFLLHSSRHLIAVGQSKIKDFTVSVRLIISKDQKEETQRMHKSTLKQSSLRQL